MTGKEGWRSLGFSGRLGHQLGERWQVYQAGIETEWSVFNMTAGTFTDDRYPTAAAAKAAAQKLDKADDAQA